MSKNGSALKVKLSSYDELFGANAPAATSDKNQIVNVALSELHTFQNHPFKVKKNTHGFIMQLRLFRVVVLISR